MATKLYDLATKTGEYRDNQGNIKGRWQNVGAVMQSDDGSQFVMLAAWFNPAGVPRKDGSESVLLSCFQPQERQQQGAAPARQAPAPQPQPQRQAPAPRQQAPAYTEPDDIPF